MKAACLLALISVIALAGCERNVVVNTPAAGAPARGISVTGDAEVKVAPDLARLLLGVEARASSAQAATERVTQQMASVVQALKQQGVAPRDLQTRELMVLFEKPNPFEPPPPPPAPMPMPMPAPGPKRGPVPVPAPDSPPDAAIPPNRPGGGEYRVTNLLEVTVRDLDRLGQLISAAMSAGANRMHGVSFDIENRDKLETEARTQAIQKARARASELARLAGVKLGPVVSITEHGAGFHPPQVPMAQMDARAEMPIERGELRVHHHVQVVFAIPERD